MRKWTSLNLPKNTIHSGSNYPQMFRLNKQSVSMQDKNRGCTFFSTLSYMNLLFSSLMFIFSKSLFITFVVYG